MNQAGAQVGNKIRQVRQARGITLQTLARRTGLTTGYLSKIERDLANPPIATISRIATALGVGITELIDEPSAENKLSIVTPSQRMAITRDGEAFGYYYESLAYALRNKLMEVFLITLVPHAEDDTFFSHEGEEMMFVLEGEMEFFYGEERHLVGEGTCLYFDSSVSHRGQCVGEREAKVLVVIASPGPAGGRTKPIDN